MSENTTTLTFPAVTAKYLDVLVYGLVFVVPLVFSHPQLVVGTLVNACLFLAAANCPMKKLTLLAILPSVAAILRGAVLGPFTPFLLYLAPFIWLGNGLLMWVFQRLSVKSVGLGVVAAAGLKALLLYVVALILVNQRVLPSVFLTSMGVLQLSTAILGGVLAVGTSYFSQRR